MKANLEKAEKFIMVGDWRQLNFDLCFSNKRVESVGVQLKIIKI